jgi:hypothetical protein
MYTSLKSYQQAATGYISSNNYIHSLKTEWVARSDGATKYWQLSSEIPLVNGQIIKFKCLGLYEGGVLISTASYGLQFRLINGIYEFFGCTAKINGVEAVSGVTTAAQTTITEFELTITTARPLGTLLSKGASFLCAAAMFDFQVVDGQSVINEIPLTNKAQGATQIATVGSVNATMLNYTGDEWEVRP